MIDHVSIAVSDLTRANAFYSAVLKPLGLTRLRAEQTRVGFGKTFAEFWINAQPSMIGPPAAAHIALRAKSPESIQAFHSAAIAHGGIDDGAPGPRDRGTGSNIYYAAFIRDPDGNRIEAVTFLSPAEAPATN